MRASFVAPFQRLQGPIAASHLFIGQLSSFPMMCMLAHAYHACYLCADCRCHAFLLAAHAWRVPVHPAACFENTVQALYKYVVPKPKAECSKNEQLGVSFAAGYIAGVFCAVVSHPADNLVSKLNSNKSATIGSIVNEMGWWAVASHPRLLSVSRFLTHHLGHVMQSYTAVQLACPHKQNARALNLCECYIHACSVWRLWGARFKALKHHMTEWQDALRSCYNCRVALATRGLPLRIVMIGTLTGLQWGIYDAFKVYVGLWVPSAPLLRCIARTIAANMQHRAVLSLGSKTGQRALRIKHAHWSRDGAQVWRQERAELRCWCLCRPTTGSAPPPEDNWWEAVAQKASLQYQQSPWRVCEADAVSAEPVTEFCEGDSK